MSYKEEWKLTIREVKEKDWPTIKKKLYFKCLKCGKPRDFKVDSVTILVPQRCAECGHNVVRIPTRISMGRGPSSDVLMLGAMMGLLPLEAHTHKELNLELAVK